MAQSEDTQSNSPTSTDWQLDKSDTFLASGALATTVGMKAPTIPPAESPETSGLSQATSFDSPLLIQFSTAPSSIASAASQAYTCGSHYRGPSSSLSPLSLAINSEQPPWASAPQALASASLHASDGINPSELRPRSFMQLGATSAPDHSQVQVAAAGSRSLKAAVNGSTSVGGSRPPAGSGTSSWRTASSSQADARGSRSWQAVGSSQADAAGGSWRQAASSSLPAGGSSQQPAGSSPADAAGSSSWHAVRSSLPDAAGGSSQQAAHSGPAVAAGSSSQQAVASSPANTAGSSSEQAAGSSPRQAADTAPLEAYGHSPQGPVAGGSMQAAAEPPLAAAGKKRSPFSRPRQFTRGVPRFTPVAPADPGQQLQGGTALDQQSPPSADAAPSRCRHTSCTACWPQAVIQLGPPLVQNIILPDQFVCNGLLSCAGSYGDVFYGTWAGQDVAIKRLIHQPRPGVREYYPIPIPARGRCDLKAELAIMARLDHPHIVRLMGVVVAEALGSSESPLMDQLLVPTMIMELAPNGSLFSKLHQDMHALDDRQRLAIAKDIAVALQYLHSHQPGRPAVVHGDLSCGNVLLDQDYKPKVCDFGRSQFKTTAQLASDGESGTPHYMAPEILRGDPFYDEKCDVFSFGVILYELVTGTRAWAGYHALAVLSLVGHHNMQLDIPDTVTAGLRDLMLDCWNKVPAKRPGFAQVVDRLTALQS